MKSLERLSAKKQERGEEKQKKRKTEGQPRHGTSPKRENAEPQRAAHHEDKDSSARKIKNHSGDDRAKRHQPDDPTFPAFANIILPAGQEEDGSEPKKVASLIPIWEGTKAALINPERRRKMGQIKHNADTRQNNDSSDEKSQLKPDRAQFEL